MSYRNQKRDPPAADCLSVTSKKVRKFTHLWRIENFRFHPKDKIIKSAPFSASSDDGVEWQLDLYPNGGGGSKGFISIYLDLISCRAGEASAAFGIHILNGNHETKATKSNRETCIFKLATNGFGADRFIERKKVLMETNFPGDTLIVRTEICYAVAEGPADPGIPFFPPIEMTVDNLSADLRKLLETGMYSDVVFDVHGREFRAHRAILAARSPTFRTLFDRNAGSTTPMKFKIRDVNTHTFSEMLHLLYTGKTSEPQSLIQNLLSKIAAQNSSTSGAALQEDSDGRKVKETMKLDETRPQGMNGSLSPESRDMISAEDSAAMSVLDSMSALIAATDSLRLDSSKVERAPGTGLTTSPCKSYPGIGLTPSAAVSAIKTLISAASVRSKWEESSISACSGNESILDMKIAGERLPESFDRSVASERNENLQEDAAKLAALRSWFYVPAANVKVFDGDRSTFFKWWREFKAQVHDRRDICTSQKLNDLLKALEGEATECIDYVLPRETMYSLTLDNLFLRYGVIGALPPGLFALLLVRQRSLWMLPLCIVDNMMLMEHIENIHLSPDAPESSKAGELKHEEKRNVLGRKMIPSEDSEKDGAVAIEKQLQELESIFANTRGPHLYIRELLAEKIGLPEVAVQTWFKLRRIDWSNALSPHWKLTEVNALRGCPIENGTIVSENSDDGDDNDFDLLETLSSSSSSTSVA